jgi:hypothetical protein
VTREVELERCELFREFKVNELDYYGCNVNVLLNCESCVERNTCPIGYHVAVVAEFLYGEWEGKE